VQTDPEIQCYSFNEYELPFPIEVGMNSQKTEFKDVLTQNLKAKKVHEY